MIPHYEGSEGIVHGHASDLVYVLCGLTKRDDARHMDLEMVEVKAFRERKVESPIKKAWSFSSVENRSSSYSCFPFNPELIRLINPVPYQTGNMARTIQKPRKSTSSNLKRQRSSSPLSSDSIPPPRSKRTKSYRGSTPVKTDKDHKALFAAADKTQRASKEKKGVKKGRNVSAHNRKEEETEEEWDDEDLLEEYDRMMEQGSLFLDRGRESSEDIEEEASPLSPRKIKKLTRPQSTQKKKKKGSDVSPSQSELYEWARKYKPGIFEKYRQAHRAKGKVREDTDIEEDDASESDNDGSSEEESDTRDEQTDVGENKAQEHESGREQQKRSIREIRYRDEQNHVKETVSIKVIEQEEERRQFEIKA